MPSDLALSNLLPGFSPTKTTSVALVTEEVVLPPCFSMISSAWLLEKFERVPVKTTFFPEK